MPTNLIRLTFDSATSIQIGWDAPADDGGYPSTINYQVYSDQGLGSGYTQIASTTNGLLTYTAPVVTGRTYYFKVKTTNEVGNSALSVASQGMLAGSVSSEPLLLSLITQSQFYVKFEWTAPLNLGGIPLTQYRVYWDAENLGTSDLSLFT